MEEEKIKKSDGLALDGPLSKEISTMKVAVRPPDIPAMDRISGIVQDLKDAGSEFPPGSSVCLRSVDGFLQFRDVTGVRIPEDSVLRVIEFDPSRGTFIVSGEGKADISTEVSWYVFKALPAINALCILPDSDSRVSESGSREARIEAMISVARSLKDKDAVKAAGLSIIKARTLEELTGYLRDHSRSQ